MADEPIKRFTLLVLFQAQQDRATELTFAPNADKGAAIKYKVDGTSHEMAPPPSHILPSVIEELLRLADIREEVFPKTGVIKMAFGSIHLRWQIVMTSPEAECVLTPIQNV